jgi:hypothetical protein
MTTPRSPVVTLVAGVTFSVGILLGAIVAGSTAIALGQFRSVRPPATGSFVIAHQDGRLPPIESGCPNHCRTIPPASIFANCPKGFAPIAGGFYGGASDQSSPDLFTNGPAPGGWELSGWDGRDDGTFLPYEVFATCVSSAQIESI